MHTHAAVLHQNDTSAPYADSQPLVITEVELDPPGPGEVLVQIIGAGLCHSDLSVINGGLGPYPLPMILGHEASGIVQELGAGVTDLHEGDHVVFSFVPACGHCLSCATGHPSLCTNGVAPMEQAHFSVAQRAFIHTRVNISLIFSASPLSLNIPSPPRNR